MTMTTRKEEE